MINNIIVCEKLFCKWNVFEWLIIDMCIYIGGNLGWYISVLFCKVMEKLLI